MTKTVDVPRRPLGRTGVDVRILGVGGYHLGSMKSRREAVRIVQEAVDAGLTFLDNAWEYHDGRSEEIMGVAPSGGRQRGLPDDQGLQPRPRPGRGHAAAGGVAKRLRTDYLDLWQIHEVVYDNDPERHFARRGAVEALGEGQARRARSASSGFTGHKDPAIHLDMLSRGFPVRRLPAPPELLRRHVPQLRAAGAARAQPPGDRGHRHEAHGRRKATPVRKRAVTATEALRYAMSLPVATTVTGIDSRRGAAAGPADRPLVPAHARRASGSACGGGARPPRRTAATRRSRSP